MALVDGLAMFTSLPLTLFIVGLVSRKVASQDRFGEWRKPRNGGATMTDYAGEAITRNTDLST